MRPISIEIFPTSSVLALPDGNSGFVPSFKARDKSSASNVINTMRCSKVAGLGALSALNVLKRSRSLNGLSSVAAGFFMAEVASARWALEGGLKDESRM